MRNSFFFIMIGLTAFLWVGCQPSPEPETETPAAVPAMSDDDMIRQVADDYVAAWNAADAATLAGLFAEDADTVVAGGYYRGRQEIQGYYAQSFDGMYEGTTLTVTTGSIRVVEPDVAIGEGTFEIAGMKDADGQDVPNMKGLYMNVMTKAADRWLITCSRPMVPVAVPGTN